MLPDAEHPPVGRTQSSVHEPVAGDVSGKFVLPERAVAFGLRAVLGAAVPETAVHEHRQFEFWENEVRFPEDFLIPPPAPNLVSPEKFCERNFRVLVSARADARHDERTLGLGENVRQISKGGKIRRIQFLELASRNTNHTTATAGHISSASSWNPGSEPS